MQIEDLCCAHGCSWVLPPSFTDNPLRSRTIAGINGAIKFGLAESEHDGLPGPAAVDGEPRTARRAAADHGRGGLGPRDRGADPPRPREEGPGARLREQQGLRQSPL